MAIKVSCFATLFLILAILYNPVQTLDNGLARTPPMGWMVWERFRCNVDCQNDPDNCIGEKLFKETADHLVSDGYLDAGYNTVSIDDCWMSMERDAQGNLYANKTRFPSGIKALADYMHERKLKLGIYQDYGTKTCAGYPGMIDHIVQDSQTFAKWGVDYLKLDGCNADPKKMDVGYPMVTKALNSTGRPIVFSCSWPDYQRATGMKPNYKLIAENCNLWRNYIDIQDSWEYVLKIIDYYAENQDVLVPAAGPGHWNDPDMLIIGNFGLSYEQSKSQLAMWSIMASPLMMSNDLRNIAPWAKDILLSKEVIAVNQDKLGVQGKRVYQENGIEIWYRQLSNNAVAAVVLSRRMDLPVTVDVPFQMVGVTSPQAHVRDLYERKDLGVYKKEFDVKVNPSGVVMVKITPQTVHV